MLAFARTRKVVLRDTGFLESRDLGSRGQTCKIEHRGTVKNEAPPLCAKFTVVNTLAVFSRDSRANIGECNVQYSYTTDIKCCKMHPFLSL